MVSHPKSWGGMQTSPYSNPQKDRKVFAKILARMLVMHSCANLLISSNLHISKVLYRCDWGLRSPTNTPFAS